MKVLAILAAVIAIAVGYPAVSTWTIHELSAAILDPSTEPAQLPYLETALNELMNGLVIGPQQPFVTAITVSLPVTATFTLEEVSEAVHDPNTHPALLPYLEDALDELMVAIINGQQDASIAVNIPAMTVNTWTLQQLSDALQNPDTDPELSIYLEFALNQLMDALSSGQQVDSIAVVTPPGVIATAPAVVAPGPVIVPEPIVPGPVVVPEPIVPGPVVVPAVSSPLVQIILNVITKQVTAPPSPPVAAVVVDEPELAPLPALPPLSPPNPALPLNPSVQPRV